MSAIEAKRMGGAIYRRLDSDGQVLGCVIRVSRTNAESFYDYLEARVQLLESCGETEGEIELTRFLHKRIGKSLGRKGNDKNGKVGLGLNAQHIERFGSLLMAQRVRLPVLMKAVVQITDAIGINSRTNLSQVKSYCSGVLKEIESMPH